VTDAERQKAFELARAAELKARAALLATTRDDVIKLLNEALDEIKVLLTDFPTEYESYRFSQLQLQIEQTLEIFSKSSAEVLANGATQAWTGGQALVTAPLEAGGIRIASVLPALDTRMLMSINHFMVDRMQDVTKVAADKIRSQLGLALVGAQSPGEAVGTITAILGEESRERAITITRTGLGSVHAVAAQQRMEQAAKRVPGLGKQWRRSGKIHSRENHDAIDGQVQPVNKPFALVAKKDGLALFMMHPHDPAAPAGEVINCGCISIPHMTSWKMLNPGKVPFSAQELQNNPLKREKAVAMGQSVNFRQPTTGGGSVYDPNAVKVAADVSSAARRAAVEIENEIRKDLLETGVFIGKNGVALLRRTGLADSVGFTVKELFRMSGATFTHNHPGGGSLSYQGMDSDLGRAFVWGLGEVRAVSGQFRYIAYPLKGAWPDVAQLELLYPDAEKHAHAVVADMVKSDQLDYSYARLEVLHQVVLFLSKRLRFGYIREAS
jgi:hypothetical protein